MNITKRMTAAEYRALINSGGARTQTDITNTQYRNRCSNDRGRFFEDAIQKGNQFYSHCGRAIVNKVYEPYRCVKKFDGGKFMGQFTGRAEPDFKGVLMGGRAIAFEAKSTQKNRIQRNVLTTEQLQWLEQQSEMEALAFVCVEIRGRFFMIPWETWRDMKQIYGRMYLTPEDVDCFELVYDGAVKYLDYVNGTTIGN